MTDSRRGFTRREVLELGALSGLTAGLATITAEADTPPIPRSATGQPRNIVFLVADGMSLGVPSLAEPFSVMVRSRGTHWHALLRTPDVVRGFSETHALNTLVTDSSAAVSAWGTGSRVFNGALNVLPDGTHLTPIGSLTRQSGRRVGLVTTTRLTNATPAGFAAVQAHRGDEHLIAPQFLDVVDVLLGGGRDKFAAGHREDKRDLLGEFVGAGYTLWDHRRQVVDGQRPPKVLGLFADAHLPYTIDQRNDADLAERVPTLAEMTSAALRLLADDERGFLLQIEGGRVDHAAHGNDAGGILWDQLAFDDAIGVALEFARRRGDTLVIVTADHGCANPGLNGMGRGYKDSTSCFELLAKARSSYPGIWDRLHKGASESEPPTVETLADITGEAFGIELATDELAAIRDAIAGTNTPDLSIQQRKLVATLGQILGNHTGIGWTGVRHTEDMVLLSALGPGAERFAGLQRNTNVYRHMAELFGIAHRNPSMSVEQARPYFASAPAEDSPHWA